MQSDENEKFLRTTEFVLKNGDRSSQMPSGRRNDGNNGVNINVFFQRLLDPSQQTNQ